MRNIYEIKTVVLQNKKYATACNQTKPLVWKLLHLKSEKQGQEITKFLKGFLNKLNHLDWFKIHFL